MEERFAPYNTHLFHPSNYWEQDSHLRELSRQPFLYENPLIRELPRKTIGIYSIGGGRQVGKTTLIKQWIASLLEEGVPPKSIFFYTGELIADHLTLVDLLSHRLKLVAEYSLHFIVIDEVTYIENWDKAIKYAADAGYFENAIVILTGSDLNLMKKARMTFPGRRGQADVVDFHLFTLSFRETLILKETIPNLSAIIKEKAWPKIDMNILYQEFDNYLLHGGYLTAINDVARSGKVSPATLKTYSDWIRGDVQKRNKQERYLKEILKAVIRRYGKQVTWNSLINELSIDSPKTILDYCELLETMDALFIQEALLEDKLVAAPKKARKLSFTDPFIYHSLKHWLYPTDDPFSEIKNTIKDPILSAELVEGVVVNQWHRYYETYYIKAEKEVDMAYINQRRFWPVEVKWRNILRPDDFKQICKYKNGKIFAKVNTFREHNKIPIVPLPIALINGDKECTNDA